MEGALFGIESFHQEILKQMHKNEKVQAALELSERLNRAGLYAHGYYIIGLPSETPQSIEEDLGTLASLNLGVTQITIVTPHPQTEMWFDLESNYGIFEKDWSKFDTKHLVWNHAHCAPGVLESLLEQGFRNCYGNDWLKRTVTKFVAKRWRERDLAGILSGPIAAREALPHRLPLLPMRSPVPANAPARSNPGSVLSPGAPYLLPAHHSAPTTGCYFRFSSVLTRFPVLYFCSIEGPMKSIHLLLFLFAPIFTAAQSTRVDHPILPIGSPAADFYLPGVDGKTHTLSDYASSPVLMVVFACNHCPISQMYEQRIQQLFDAYTSKGVAVVVIQPNDPKALRIDELDSSDSSDTLEEMKIRVAWKHLTYPYLYDGETQSTTRAYGPQATPHVFIFDSTRHLRYEGRFDNSYRIEQVKTQDARNAIDALLAQKDPPVTHTGSFGCSTKWTEKSADRVAMVRKLDAQPVDVSPVSADGLKTLRANPFRKYTLINFWATWCGACVDEFADLEKTFRMYSVRDIDYVTVAVNQPDERDGVLRMLRHFHSTGRNLLFDSAETQSLERAFNPNWDSAVPYTVFLDPDGKILYEQLGSIDILKLRRTILAALPSDYSGFNQYWSSGLADAAHK